MLLHVTVFERGTGLHNIHKLIDFVQSAIAASTKKKKKKPLKRSDAIRCSVYITRKQ